MRSFAKHEIVSTNLVFFQVGNRYWHTLPAGVNVRYVVDDAAILAALHADANIISRACATIVFVFAPGVRVTVHENSVAEEVHVVAVLAVNAAVPVPVRDIVGDKNTPTILELLIALQRNTLAFIDLRVDERFGTNPGEDFVVVMVHLVAHDDGAVVFCSSRCLSW